MGYLRFVAHLAPDETGTPTGLFTALYRLEAADQLAAGETEWFREQETWFTSNLPAPTRLARSARRGAPRRAVLWFRDSAAEHLTRMHALAALLRTKDIAVEVWQTERPGYIVYQDEWQVAAEPFQGEATES